MRQIIKALAFLAGLLPTLAAAQTQIPNLPPNTVLGRTGVTAGPAQAIPFSVLSGALSQPSPFPAPTRSGDIIYWNGSAWASLPGNNTGNQFLQESSGGVPSWVGGIGGGGTVTTNNPNTFTAQQDFITTDGGVVSNPNILYGLNLKAAYDINAQLSPGFSDANAFDMSISADHGNYVYGNGTNSKTTFLMVSKSGDFRAAGQRFMDAGFMSCHGIGDCAWYGSHNITVNSYNIGGDEGQGWGLVSSINQSVTGSVMTITAVTSNTCNTTITQNITSSQNQQTFTVASGTGCTAGTWIVMNHEPATAFPNHEAAKIISSTATSITAIIAGNYTIGMTVTPAVQVTTTGGTEEFGEGRVIVNNSQSAYITGTVSAVNSPSSDLFTGSGTAWSNTMLTGGTAITPGCIALTADDQAISTPTLKEWYQIISVNSATQLRIFSTSIANDNSYHGVGPGTGAYTIRPCAELLRIGPNANTDMILDSNGFTWSVGDSIEQTIPPWPDFTGFTYEVNYATHGGSYRSFMSIFNIGYRTIQNGLSLQGLSCFATGGLCDPVAFGTGISLASVNTGINIQRAHTAAIVMGCGTTCDSGSPGVQDGRINWGPSGFFYMQPNTANQGMDLLLSHGTGSGLLQASSTGLGRLVWGGQLGTVSTTNASLAACSAATEGDMISVHDSSVITWGSTYAAGGTNKVMIRCNGTNWTVVGI